MERRHQEPAVEIELGGFTLERLHAHLRRRADQKIGHAEAIFLLRARGYSHEACRHQLGLTVEQYRNAKRWLRDAVAAVTLNGD